MDLETIRGCGVEYGTEGTSPEYERERECERECEFGCELGCELRVTVTDASQLKGIKDTQHHHLLVAPSCRARPGFPL